MGRDGRTEKADYAAVVTAADEGEPLAELVQLEGAAELPLEDDDVSAADGGAPGGGGGGLLGQEVVGGRPDL